MLFSMLGSIFSGRRDYTKVPAQRPAVQTYPYKSDAVGFNTRFSLNDLQSRVRRGKSLTQDEQEFLDYIESLEEGN